MAELSLRAYIQQIDHLIERKQVDEAIAHCRHILLVYPKQVDTYRMLGKALLEKGRHGDAADIFQRVLSVLPDDFISNVGMAIVREDDANLDHAIWHMERAFEAAPSNGAIQQELCRLIGRRDGVIPPKARLTRGALARMYNQGGLFMQAEAELKLAISEEPGRMDLHTTLAQVYWRTAQPAQAAQTCGQILDSLPYSLHANRIMLDIFRAQGRAAEGAVYQQRVEAIDPYEAFAEPGSDSPGAAAVDENLVKVQRLDYIPGADASGSPDWIAAIGARFEDPPAAHRADEQPDWLNTASPAASQPPEAAELPDWLAGMQPASPAAAPGGDDDWLSNLGLPLGGETEPEPLPGWLRSATGPLSPSDLPAWMQAEANAADAASTASPEHGTEGEVEGQPLDVPDWIRAAVGNTDPPGPDYATNEPEAPGQTPLPSWLDDSGNAGLPAGTPDWLAAVASLAGAGASGALEAFVPPGSAQAGTESSGDSTAPYQPTDADTTWMAQPEPHLASITSRAPAGGSEPPTEIPDWLAAMVTPDDSPAEGVPDWLASISAPAAVGDETHLPGPLPDLPAAEIAPQAGDDSTIIPASMPSETAAPAADDETMTPAAPEPQAAADDDAVPAELPDWLTAAAASAPPPDAAGDDWQRAAVELPDYLQPASPEAIARAQQPFDLSEDTLDIEDDAEDDEDDGPIALPAEIPDWLRAMAPISPDPEPDDDLPARAGVAADIESAAPDLSGLGADEPLPWLEGLTDAVGQPTAEAAEVPDWLAAASAKQDALPDDLPPWASPQEPGPTDTVTTWLAGKHDPEWSTRMREAAQVAGLTEDAPAEQSAGAELGAERAAQTDDWLRQVEASFPPDELADTAPHAVVPAEAAAQAEPPAAQAVDDAQAEDGMRWLEALAARQGASEEELLTAPEDRLTDMPAWLAAEISQPAAEDGEPVAEANAAADMPDWLRGMRADAQAGAARDADATLYVPATADSAADAPDWLIQPPAAAEEMAETAALDAGDADDGTPDWLRAPAPAETMAEATAADIGDDDSLPEWLRAPVPAEAVAETTEEAAAEPMAETTAADIGDDDSLPEWLRAPAPTEAMAEATAEAADEPVAEAADEAIAEPAADLHLPEWLRGLPADPDTGAASASAPDWLTHDLAAESASLAEPETAEPAMASAISSDDAPAELGGVDDEVSEAMRWLEGLAAQQGANPDELISAPEDRPAEAPAWIAAQQTTAAQPAPGEIPDWLAALEADDTPAEVLRTPDPWQAIVRPPDSSGEPASEQADEQVDQEAAQRWLDSLAQDAMQGGTAEETLTAAEPDAELPSALSAALEDTAAEPDAEIPAAVSAELEAETAASEASAGASADIAEGQAKPEPELAQAALGAAAAVPAADVEKLSRLADRLAEARRAKDAEIEARFETQRAEQEAARRAVQERMDAQRAALESAAGAPARQADAQPEPDEQPEPARQPEPAQQPEPVYAAESASEQTHELAGPPRPPVRARQAARAPSIYAEQPAEAVLASARQLLESRDYDGAADALEHLAAANQASDAVIQDAERAAADPAAPPRLLQALGDAYARRNDLQRALDTYRAALKRL